MICQCDCDCIKEDDLMTGDPMQCDDCDNGIHWNKAKKVYEKYD